MPEAERKANKGEWSELYAFLKILELRQLPAADKNLDPIEGKFFVFQKVIRAEKDESPKIYDISRNDTEIVISGDNGDVLKTITDLQLGTKTKKIFDKIVSGDDATFEIKEADDLMDELLCTKIKASNYEKADIVAVIHDRISETTPMLGFSVKSMVGGASTLLNAGRTTNFIYEVTGFLGDKEAVNSIDTRNKIRDRLSAIEVGGGKLNFRMLSNSAFASNLRNIDTAFPRFLAQMILDFFHGKDSTVVGLLKLLSEHKELQQEFGLSASGYEVKMKNFLDSVALGMVPSVEWDGFTKAHGGYIVVKHNGDLVCYHLYNRDEFRTYLYENTKFETASSSRHEYGKLYGKDGKLYFNLNLQIRFLK